jgi:hypothetical protein
MYMYTTKCQCLPSADKTETMTSAAGMSHSRFYKQE